MKKHIFIFNPETDYALAVGNTRYNPPMPVVKLRETMQLVQSRIASKGDIILVSDNFSSHSYPDKESLQLLSAKDISTLTLSEIQSLARTGNFNNWSLHPWGWNYSLRCQLADAGIPAEYLKSEVEIDRLRNLSHRHSTIPFLKHLFTSLPYLQLPLPRELFSVQDALSFLEIHRKVYFKAPWSSSGRGVIFFDIDQSQLNQNGNNGINILKLKEWLGGFIRRQGSVMGEKAYIRATDFATEWMISESKASFLGLSLFKTSSEGRYAGNSLLPQEEIGKILSKLSTFWNQEIIDAQRQALETLIAPDYSGPAGIDMLIDIDGRINPCVEINLRMTMGMIALGQPLMTTTYDS